jgi:hypothetical protein
METIILAILFTYIVGGGIRVFIGLDLRRWTSWLYGIYGFLSGFLIGFLIADIQLGLQVGAIFAFAVMYGGAMIHWHRQRFKE